MAATSKLTVYNDVLREIGGQPLANTTTANTRLLELEGAFPHAVEHMLSRADWSFARRRAMLTGIADTSFPPYTYRFTKPTDYLRRCWIKESAADAHQTDAAEVGAVFYAAVNDALLEYISDTADNYDPVNWPPHFVRCLVLYLAQLVAPRLARAGAGESGMLEGKLQSALADAVEFEAVFLTNKQIATNRQPVYRRALEFMGQALAGSVNVHSQADKLRWHMDQAFDHCARYVLELGAWNFAAKRARLSSGVAADDVVPMSDASGIIVGYSYGSEPSSTSTLPSASGYTYAWSMPDDFLHKIWIKSYADAVDEVPHQQIGYHMFTNVDPVIMEYVAENDYTTDPDNWSANFLEAVAAYLALMVSPELVIEGGGKSAKLMANDLKPKLEAVWVSKLSDAKLRDAIQQYPKSIPAGSWARARMGGSVSLTRLR
jgi:hypothetical protein